MAEEQTPAAKANISDLHMEWESDRVVRRQVRDNKCLFRSEKNSQEVPHVNVKSACLNYDVLLPLARRLVEREGGECLMVSVPALVLERLRPMFRHTSLTCFVLCVSYGGLLDIVFNTCFENIFSRLWHLILTNSNNSNHSPSRT